MPELPEVQAFTDFIDSTSIGKPIVDVQAKAKRLVRHAVFDDFKDTLKKHHFQSVQRRGKYTIIQLTKTKKLVIMHYGMTGFVAYTQKEQETPKYAQVTFIFDDGSALHWINKRTFGKIWLVDDPDEIDALKELGPDALDITEQQFLTLCYEHQRKNIKALLMDQSILAGIGNEYSDEILFQAGIDPHASVADLTSSGVKNIYKQMRKVLDYFIKQRTSFVADTQSDDFDRQNETDIKNKYLQAHRHTDKKCPKNNEHTLKNETIAGRSAYFCPKHQVKG